MKHVMIDLETLGRGPGCVILSIGAVQFDPESGQLGEKFYMVLNRESCHAVGLGEDDVTLKWWSEQSEEAKKVLIDADRKGSPNILAVLAHFRDYLASVGGARNFSSAGFYLKSLENVCVWGNGVEFDNATLTYAYRASGVELPWKFWNNRCYRTLKNVYKDVQMPIRRGTHHNALDDAITQAEHAIEILRYAKWERVPGWLRKWYFFLRKHLII